MINFKNLCELFKIREKQLFYYAYSNNKYQESYILKSDWSKRRILIPNSQLKRIQRIILTKILNTYWNSEQGDVRESINWFCKSKSILTNSQIHSQKSLVIKFDIESFFPSISYSRVFWVFHKKIGLTAKVSGILAWICCYNNELPQWAPTSPMISNIIVENLDRRIFYYLQKVWDSRRIKINYSRYADDITISIPINNLYLAKMISKKIFLFIKEENFLVNYSKYKIISNNHQQKVTWVIINNKPSLWRSNYRNLRAINYNLKKCFELSNPQKELKKQIKKWNKKYWDDIKLVEQFINTIRWKNAFYNFINPSYQKLDFKNIDL